MYPLTLTTYLSQCGKYVTYMQKYNFPNTVTAVLHLVTLKTKKAITVDDLQKNPITASKSLVLNPNN